MAALSLTRSGQGEVGRVAAHLWRAERVAGQRSTRGLCPVQRRVRRLLLAELRSYRLRGQFPKNPLFAELTPFFVDAHGTRCAVAHLLEVSGEGELVQRIARERNNARVAELADEPRLRAWLDAAGLTLDEAALIQPSYCYSATGCICENRATGYLEVTTTTTATDNIATAEVKVIHGEVDRGLEVGSEIQVESYSRDVPRELIVRGISSDALEDGTPYYTGVDVTDGGYGCDWGGPLSKQQYLQAVQSSNCDEVVESFDNWKGDECDSACGCRAVGAGSPSPAGILAALVGAIVARRMARRA